MNDLWEKNKIFNSICICLPSLRDPRVSNNVVQSDVAAGLNTFGCEEEAHPGHALHSVPPLVQDQPLGAEATLVVEEETESWQWQTNTDEEQYLKKAENIAIL